MRKTKFFVMFLAVTFCACSSLKKTASKSSSTDSNTVAMSDSSNDTSMKQNSDSFQSGANPKDMQEVAGSSTVAQVNGSTGAMNNVQANGEIKGSGMDFGQMYTELQMTDDQIHTFESAMEAFQQKRISTPNGDMMGTMDSERTRQLEAILTGSQLEKYESWQADNN